MLKDTIPNVNFKKSNQIKPIDTNPKRKKKMFKSLALLNRDYKDHYKIQQKEKVMHKINNNMILQPEEKCLYPIHN